MNAPIYSPLRGDSLYEKVMNYTRQQGDCIVFTRGLGGKGYGYVGHNGVRARAHRVVAEHHFGKSNLDVLHLCDNPACVNYKHLKYGTHHENMIDAMNKKRNAIGARNRHNKLSEEQVLKIYNDTRSQAEIAREYSVKQSSIWCIKNGKSWSWLTGHRKLIR